MLHLFRGHGGEVAAPFVGFEQDVVGDDVEFLLRFALDVAGPGAAQHIGEGTLADVDRNGLAGPGDDFNQKTEVGGNDVFVALLLDEVARQRDFCHGNRESEGSLNYTCRLLAHSAPQITLRYSETP